MGPKVLQDRFGELQNLQDPGYPGVVLPGNPSHRPGGLEALSLHQAPVKLRPGDGANPAQVGLVLPPSPMVDRAFRQDIGLGGEFQDPPPALVAGVALGLGGKGTGEGISALSRLLGPSDQLMGRPAWFATRIRWDPKPYPA